MAIIYLISSYLIKKIQFNNHIKYLKDNIKKRQLINVTA